MILIATVIRKSIEIADAMFLSLLFLIYRFVLL